MQGISTSHLAPLLTLLLLSLASIAWGGELPRAEPEAVGLSAGKLAELKPALQKLVDEGKIPGGLSWLRGMARWPTRPRSATATWPASHP